MTPVIGDLRRCRIGYTTIEALDAAFPAALYQREGLPWEAGFLAGKCFLMYRRRGGMRSSLLHRRARRDRPSRAANPRCPEVSHVFPGTGNPRSRRSSLASYDLEPLGTMLRQQSNASIERCHYAIVRGC